LTEGFPAQEATKLLRQFPGGGLLSGKFNRDNQKPSDSRRSEFDFPVVDKERAWNIIDVSATIAQVHGCSPARVALAWLLSRPIVTSVILGAKRIEQLEDDLAAADLKLTDDELRKLDEVSALPPEYPGWMLATQGADRLGPVELWAKATASAS
jgi:aryl-alcohol dehydrogenase-like predicted oxidoreductase